ncbi:MAG: IS4/Tn5 family transposase DNA-binding protein [Methylocella sp.]
MSPKAIDVYPLANHFRARIGWSTHAGRVALARTDGLDSDVWAQPAFGDAALGDARLSQRLVSVAAAQAEVPERAFSGVAQGDWPALKAY